LLIIFTGDGKGKTTAALGMALRASGHRMRVLILQFIKGGWSYGELDAVGRLDSVTIEPMGTGFTWTKESLEEDRRLAEAGWERAVQAIESGGYDLVVLDELNIVLRYGLLPVQQVTARLLARPSHVHVVATGRGAPEQLLAAADLVTEMQAVKHPYRDQGIGAQPGIEY
jgi:cob(I)alamin adenosyltransferase